MKKIMGLYFAFLLASGYAAVLLMSGCATDPDIPSTGVTPFGKIQAFARVNVQKAANARERYCTDPTNEAKRAVAIFAVRQFIPAYPADGLCTGLFDNVIDITPVVDEPVEDKPVVK